MSTRCQIGFYTDMPTRASIDKPDALIYRHSDGYPDRQYGVSATIVPLLLEFTNKRGFWDSEYCAGYVLAHWMTGVTGYGVTQRLHGDIEYYYAVYDKGLQVYETSRVFRLSERPSFDDMVLVDTLTW